MENKDSILDLIQCILYESSEARVLVTELHLHNFIHSKKEEISESYDVNLDFYVNDGQVLSTSIQDYVRILIKNGLVARWTNSHSLTCMHPRYKEFSSTTIELSKNFVEFMIKES